MLVDILVVSQSQHWTPPYLEVQSALYCTSPPVTPLVTSTPLYTLLQSLQSPQSVNSPIGCAGKVTELVIISQVSRKVTHISVCTDYTSGPADHILSSVRFQLELSVPGSGKCDAVSVKMNLVTSQPLPVTRERLVYDGECLSVLSSHMCHNRCRHLSPSEGSPR